MFNIILAWSLVIVAILAGLRLWRWADMRSANASWTRLAGTPVARNERFDAALVRDLPEPVRRYLGFVIAPGARLSTAGEVDMEGELSLGTRDKPAYQPMLARQILHPPHGLVWQVSAGRGLVRISGSDGIEGVRSWSRFWLSGLIPVVRVGGSRDHLRAAFGRLVGEAAIWAPAALLLQGGVTWQAADEDTVRVTVSRGGLTQTVDIRVDEEGRPTWFLIPRWTDANADKVFRLQPFGGFVSEFREFDGYRLPVRVEAGNFFGTQDYFPFYKAHVRAIRFL